MYETERFQHALSACRPLGRIFSIPVFGIVWGVLFLGESVSIALLVGLVIILISVAFVVNVSLGKRATPHASDL